jgi:hypothetical protein
LTARTDAATEVAEVTAAEAAAAEAAAAVEAAASTEAAAAAGAVAKAAADAPSARADLTPELPKEPGGGAGGMAEDAEVIPGRPVLSVGAREELKTRVGSLSSEGANAAVITTPIMPPSAPERTLQASGQGQAIGRPKGGLPFCSLPASTARWVASGAKPLPKKQRRKRRR